MSSGMKNRCSPSACSDFCLARNWGKTFPTTSPSLPADLWPNPHPQLIRLRVWMSSAIWRTRRWLPLLNRPLRSRSLTNTTTRSTSGHLIDYNSNSSGCVISLYSSTGRPIRNTSLRKNHSTTPLHPSTLSLETLWSRWPQYRDDCHPLRLCPYSVGILQRQSDHVESTCGF